MEKDTRDRSAWKKNLSRREFLAFLGAGLTGAALLGAKEITVEQTALPALAQSRSIVNGAYIPGMPWEPSRIDEFTDMVGTSPKIIAWFEEWSNGDFGDLGFSVERVEAAHSRGAMPMVTWNSWNQRLDKKNQPKYALKTIVRGDHDGYIRQWARDAAAYGKPIYLRLNHEMNSDWYPWSVGANGNSAADYVEHWRRIHDIFEEEEATNIRWVWTPVIKDDSSTASFSPSDTYTDRMIASSNSTEGNDIAFDRVYPGDDYVDWVGLDGYNWGTTRDWSRWRGFSDIFEASYTELTALTGKPMMIAETGSVEDGGDKAAWIRQAFLEEVPSRFPLVQAIAYASDEWEVDWRVNTSPEALDAYKEVAVSPLYQGQLP